MTTMMATMDQHAVFATGYYELPSPSYTSMEESESSLISQSTFASPPSKRNNTKQRDSDEKSLILLSPKAPEEDEYITPLPLYTPLDELPPPAYSQNVEEEAATIHILRPKSLNPNPENFSASLFGGGLYGVRERAPKKKAAKGSSTAKKNADKKTTAKATTTGGKISGSGGVGGAGDDEDDKKRKEEDRRREDEKEEKKRKEEEQEKKKKEEEQEKKRKEEEEAAAEEERLRLEEEEKERLRLEEEKKDRLRLEEEKRIADEIANSTSGWGNDGDEEEENTGGGWGFLGRRKKEIKVKKVAPSQAPPPPPVPTPPVTEVAPAPAPPPPPTPPQEETVTGGFAEALEVVQEVQETPKEKEKREKLEKRKRKEEERLARLSKGLPTRKSRREVEAEAAAAKTTAEVIEAPVPAPTPAPPPEEEAVPAPELPVESDEVVSPKIDVDDIDDNEDNVSPTNSASKLSGFGGIGLGWKFGLGLTKWGAASQGSVDSTSPNSSTIGSKKTIPVDETPKDLFPQTKKKLGEGVTKQSKAEPEPLPEPEPVVVVEPEPAPVKDEIPEPVTKPVTMPQVPVEDDFGCPKKMKKGKKAEKKPVKADTKIPEETEKKKTGKVASLAGVYEKRASTIKKDAVEKSSKSKSKSAAIPVEEPTEPEVPEPEPIVEPPAKESIAALEDEDEPYYGPGYEKVKQRKYGDTPEVRYAGKSNIGYVPAPKETPYVPIPKEPAYAPVPEGPRYAEPKQFEYATPSVWGPGKKSRKSGRVEVATAPAPPPPVVERIPTPDPEPIPESIVEQPELKPEPEPEPEPQYIIEPEPELVPEPVKPTKSEKKQKKKKGWFFTEPDEPEPEPVPEPPVEEIPAAEEVVQVMDAEPEPEEPGVEFVEDVAEVVEAEPGSEVPTIAKPEVAPAPGPEARKTRKDVKDVSVWSLLAPPKPKKRGPDLEKSKERRLSTEVDANGNPVKTVGLRELWKMNKEVEKKKKNTRGLSPVEKWQADVVPEMPPPDEGEYNSLEEVDKNGHVDNADADIPLSSPPPTMLPIESYLVPDTPIATQAPSPVWKEAPPLFAPVSRKSPSKRDRKKRSDPTVELQANPIVEEPEPAVEPEPAPVPEPTKRETRQKKKTWGLFFETVDEPEPEPELVVEPEPKPVVEAPTLELEPVIEEPEPIVEAAPELEPAKTQRKERKQKKKGWFFESPESDTEPEPVAREPAQEPEIGPVQEPIVKPEPAPVPTPEPASRLPVRSNRNTKKGWIFGGSTQSPASEPPTPSVSEPVPELESESAGEPEFEQESSARTPEPSEPEAHFEEALGEEYPSTRLAIEWPEEKVRSKERRHSQNHKDLKEGVVEPKKKEKRRSRKLDDSIAATSTSRPPLTERRGTYALSGAPIMERRGTHSSSAPSMERRNTTSSHNDEAEKAARRERRRLRKLAEEEAEKVRLAKEAEERELAEKEQRRAERREKRARKEAEEREARLAAEKHALAKEAERLAREEKPKIERRKSSKRHTHIEPAAGVVEETREEKEARREARRAKKAVKEHSSGAASSGSHGKSHRHSINHATQLATAMKGIPNSTDPYSLEGERSDHYQSAYEEEARRRRRLERHNIKKAQKAGIWTNGEAISGSVTPERVPTEEINGANFSSSTSQDLAQEEAIRERRRKRKEARRSLHETVEDDEAKRLRKLQKKEEKRAKELKEINVVKGKDAKMSGAKEKAIKNPEDRALKREQRAKRRAESERFNGALTENEGSSKNKWWKKLLG